MTYSAYMPVDQVDETADYTDMQGPSSTLNQLAGKVPWSQNPTMSLVVLWFVVLAAYWFVGWFFRGQRS
jgi:hypothetical protein